jgi:hypothetical protein
MIDQPFRANSGVDNKPLASFRQWREITDRPISRHEAKYIVPIEMMPSIREYIQSFVVPDKNGVGSFPQYWVRTLQLDAPDLSLHHAKERETLNRFKLRIRTYGKECKAPVFLEIKRKLGGTIVKSRATVSNGDYHPDLLLKSCKALKFKNEQEQMNYLNFIRLQNEIGARPKVMLQYLRESYMGRQENYARITFDTQVAYQPVRGYDFEQVQNRRWRKIDTQTGLNIDFPGFILEIKTESGMPFWMRNLVQNFDLTRVGFCKYSTAIRMELLHYGHEFSATGENCTPASTW